MCYSVYKNVCASFLWLEMRLESNGVWKRIPCTRYHSFCFLHIATWVSFIPFSTLLPCRLLPHHSILFITITTQQNLPLDHDGGECEQMLVVVIIMKWQKDAPGTLQLFWGLKVIFVSFSLCTLFHTEISQSEIRGCSQLGCPLHIVY